MAFNEWKENSCLAVDSGSGQNHSLENWTNNHFLFIQSLSNPSISSLVKSWLMQTVTQLPKSVERYKKGHDPIWLQLNPFFVSTWRNTYHAISILFEIKLQSEIRFHFICNYFVLSKNKDELICWQLKISMKYMLDVFWCYTCHRSNEKYDPSLQSKPIL